MSATYKPLGQAVGILETNMLRYVRIGGFSPEGELEYAIPVCCLVWRPGEDPMSDCAWYGITEGMREAEEAAEAAL